MNKTYIFGSISPNRSTLTKDIQVLLDSMISIFTQNLLYRLNKENVENLQRQQVVGNKDKYFPNRQTLGDARFKQVIQNIQM